MTQRNIFDLKKNVNYIIFAVLGVALILSLVITSLFLSDKNSNLNSNSKAALNSAVLLSFDQNNITPNVGDEFSIDFRAKPQNTINVKQYDIQINFDATKIFVKDITYQLGNATGNGTDNTQTKLDEANTRGSIALSGAVSDANGYQLTSNKLATLATIKFKRLTNDYNEVSVPDTKASFIVVQNDGTLKLITAALVQVLKILNPTTQTTVVYSPAETTAVLTNTVTPTPTHTLQPTYTPLPTYVKYSGNPYTPIPLTPPTYTVVATAIPSTTKKLPSPTPSQEGKPTATNPNFTLILTTTGTITPTPVPTATTKPTNTLAPTTTSKVDFADATGVASPLEIVIWLLIILVSAALVVLLGAFGYKKYLEMNKKK